MTEILGSRPWCIPVANQKGGVGKTTVALGLAAAIEDSSGSVIVFDADPQQSAMEIAAAGSLPFQVRPALSAAELASIRQVRGVDTVIIDLPGNLTDTPVLGEVLAASDFAVIPVVPERAAILPTQRTAQIIADQGLPLQDPVQPGGPAARPGAGRAAARAARRPGPPLLLELHPAVCRAPAIPARRPAGYCLPR